MDDWLEAFHPIYYHVFIRFGKWEEIIKYDIPENKNLYIVTTVTA